jgi:hypothetical protein
LPIARLETAFPSATVAEEHGPRALLLRGCIRRGSPTRARGPSRGRISSSCAGGRPAVHLSWTLLGAGGGCGPEAAQLPDVAAVHAGARAERGTARAHHLREANTYAGATRAHPRIPLTADIVSVLCACGATRPAGAPTKSDSFLQAATREARPPTWGRRLIGSAVPGRAVRRTPSSASGAARGRRVHRGQHYRSRSGFPKDTRDRGIARGNRRPAGKQAAGAVPRESPAVLPPEDIWASSRNSRDGRGHDPESFRASCRSPTRRLRRVLELSGEELRRELALALRVEPTVEGPAEGRWSPRSRACPRRRRGGAPASSSTRSTATTRVLAVLRDAGISTSSLQKGSRPMDCDPHPVSRRNDPRLPPHRRASRESQARRLRRTRADAIAGAELEADRGAPLRQRHPADGDGGLGLGRHRLRRFPRTFSLLRPGARRGEQSVGVLRRGSRGARAQDGSIGLRRYFTAARGAGQNAPLEMTKWFDTNNYLVCPRFGAETASRSRAAVFAAQVARTARGFTVRPVDRRGR